MAAYQNRLRLFSLIIILFGLFLVGKLYMVQIVNGENYKARAEHQYVSNNYFDRGSIYFTSKSGALVPAAAIQSGYLLAINPSVLSKNSDIDKVYEDLNNIIEIDKDTFLIKAGKDTDPYEEIRHKLTEEESDAIKALDISGVILTSERWRVYPGEDIASHAVGLIGYNGNELAGRYGLERYYESILGRESDNVFINFFAEIFSNIKSVVLEGESLEGDVVTSIEPSVQAFLETELKGVTDKYSSERSGGIVIDPMTGEIVAMAIYPDFDPNSPQSETSSSVFRNNLVEDRYEMGSIIKALTLAAGIDSGSVTARTTYNDPGCMTLNTKTFCNYDGKSHGTAVSMQEMISQSLNTGAAFVALRMGNKQFSDYMLKFGLDKTTKIDLPNEGKSLVENLYEHRDLETAQASFGQGIAMTPIITVRALSALANGGTLIDPHIVKEVRYDIGGRKVVSPILEESRERVISKETSLEVSRMLTESVDRTLREGGERLENYSVAAKTGTAQIANPEAGGYYADRFLHSFFGYFPSYEPEYLIFLYTHNPRGVRFASETLTDSFMNMTKFLIGYYEIPPDRESAPPAPR